MSMLRVESGELNPGSVLNSQLLDLRFGQAGHGGYGGVVEDIQ